MCVYMYICVHIYAYIFLILFILLILYLFANGTLFKSLDFNKYGRIKKEKKNNIIQNE